MTEAEEPESDAAPDPDTSGGTKPAKPWRTRLRIWAHGKLPRLIESPLLKRSRERHWRRDDDANAKSTPGVDERSVLYCLWATEFYTPSHTESLLAAFAKLGWAGNDPAMSDRDPAAWLQQSRRGALRGGWMNLGTLVPPRKRRSYLHGREIEIVLPPNVEYALAHLFTLSSSIACIVVCFVFEEGYASVFDDALRVRYKTKFERLKHGHRILGPRSQKERRIQEIREELRRHAVSWFRQNLPGVFSRADAMGNFPTCEFVVFTDPQSPPQAHPNGPTKGLHRTYLGVTESWARWESIDVPGLFFTWPVLRDRAARFHATLSISKASLQSLDMTLFGGHSRSAYLAFFERDIPTLLSRWACLALIDVYQTKINDLRDSRIFAVADTDPAKLLQELRLITSDSIDISSIAPDLEDLTKEPALFDHGTGSFTQPHPLSNQPPLDLLSGLKKEIVLSARRLQATDRSVRDLLLQQGNLASASENIVLQRRMRWLTSVLMWLTVAILALTALMAYQMFFSAQNAAPESQATLGDGPVPREAPRQLLQ